jgi:hypothetical protein
MSLELGRLFHLWGRCAGVSVGVCMVSDLLLIPRSNPPIPHGKDCHRSLISTRCFRCCFWARDGVGVTGEGIHVQWCWYIGSLCRLGDSSPTTARGWQWGSCRSSIYQLGVRYVWLTFHRRDWRITPRQNRTMMAGCSVMTLFQLAPVRQILEVSEIWMRGRYRSRHSTITPSAGKADR